MYRMYGVGSSGGAGMIVLGVIFSLLVVVGAIVLHFTFLSDKNEGRYTGFLGWLYDFLTFRKLWIEGILRVLYLICALMISLVAFVMLFKAGGFFEGIISFLSIFVLGNLIFRLLYELSLLSVLLCKNVISINKKLGGKEKTPKFEQNAGMRTPGPAPQRKPASRPVPPAQRNTPPVQRNTPPTQGNTQPVPRNAAPLAQRMASPASDTMAAPRSAAPGETPAAPRARFCKNCGTKMSPEETFCPNCGKQR
ncbi:MAG: zinc-ribbon domain-containing protein [Blautia sp.]|nr:zinc-ribbon domain-containing protein [Blautia sp.]MDY5032283.1 zinc-ribbon domain-containing protein [Blautia sp.]